MKAELGSQVYQVTPSDANVVGTIFGGRVMELATEVSAISARRFAKKPVVVASLERIDFLHPIYVGEEIQVTPTLVRSYKHSMQYVVRTEAINPFSGETRLTAKTILAFVAVDPKTGKPSKVPPYINKKHPDLEYCEELYKQHKDGKDNLKVKPNAKLEFLGSTPGKKVSESRVENIHLIMPGDYNEMGLLVAGKYLSWVDIIGSLSAGRFCRKPVVTASIEGVNFKQRVPKGSVVRLTAHVTYAANTSMEVLVEGWVLDQSPKDLPDKKIGDAHLTFVAIDKAGKRAKPAEVPRLILSGKDEKFAYLRGQFRHEENKKHH